NIQRIVFPMLDNAKKRNTIVLNWRDGPARIKYDVRRDSFFRRTMHRARWLVATIFGYIKYDQFDKQASIISRIKQYRPKLFCIHNVPKNKIQMVTEFLEDAFPNKSKFEK
ncbi:MAG: hypothetical protein FWF34_02740, partial [Alphaproteobacteria bacterium]|nr:hypothetical protein [Alphaproteobacteria bacterium]